jgi:hypothetical protein
MKLVRLIKMCLTETYSIVQECKHLSDGLKLNDTHQLMVSAADVNILGGSVTYCKGKHRGFSKY